MRIPDSEHLLNPQTQPLATGSTTAAGRTVAAHTGAASSVPSSGDASDEAYLSGDSQTIQNGIADHSRSLQALTASVRAGTYLVPTDQVSRALVTESLACIQ